MARNFPLHARLLTAGLLGLLAAPAAMALPLGLQSPVPLPVPVPAIGNQTVDTPLGPAYVDTDTGNVGADLATPPLPLPVPVGAQASIRAHAGLDGATAGADATAQAAHVSAGAHPSAGASDKGVMAKIGAWIKGLFD